MASFLFNALEIGDDSMSGVSMYLPCTVECDSCGREDEFPYKLNLLGAQRSKRVFRPQWVKAVREEVAEAARLQGWLIDPAGCYCPECSQRFGSGEIHHHAKSLDARSLMRDMSLIVRTERERRSGKGK